MAAQPDRYGSSSEEGDSGSVSGPSTPGSASAPEDSATSGLGEEGAEESSEEGAADPSLGRKAPSLVPFVVAGPWVSQHGTQ